MFFETAIFDWNIKPLDEETFESKTGDELGKLEPRKPKVIYCLLSLSWILIIRELSSNFIFCIYFFNWATSSFDSFSLVSCGDWKEDEKNQSVKWFLDPKSPFWILLTNSLKINCYWQQEDKARKDYKHQLDLENLVISSQKKEQAQIDQEKKYGRPI
jgi:hypothetical protein